MMNSTSRLTIAQRALPVTAITVPKRIGPIQLVARPEKLKKPKNSAVLCGGDISAGTWVDPWYLLDLEREALLSLLGEQKTRDRMMHMLQTGKPLRNYWSET